MYESSVPACCLREWLDRDFRSLPNTFSNMQTCGPVIFNENELKYGLLLPNKALKAADRFSGRFEVFERFFLLFHETTKSEKHKISSHHWNFKQFFKLIGQTQLFRPVDVQPLPWKSTSHLKNAMASLVSDFLVKRRDEIEVFQMVSYNVSKIAWCSVHMKNCFIFMILLYHISAVCKPVGHGSAQIQSQGVFMRRRLTEKSLEDRRVNLHIGYMPNSGIKTLVVVCTSAGMSMHMLITGGCGSLIFFFKTFRLSKVYPITKSTKRNTEPAKY